jgi:hypothetical protein
MRRVLGGAVDERRPHHDHRDTNLNTTDIDHSTVHE